MKKIKTAVYQLVEKGSHGKRFNLTFDYFIMTIIILSVCVIILESIPEINKEFGTLLRTFNILSIVIFTVEYFLRIYVSDQTHPSSSRLKSSLRYIFSIHGLIDLLAIIPFYLPMFFKMDLRFIRVLRITRFFRIMKLNRYNNSLSIIATVIKEKKSELAVTGFVTFLILLLASFLMYFIEGEQQKEQFPNIIASFWWAIATLTTVGYGDVYPVTGLGKLISGFIAVLGIGLVALPTGLISAGFISKIEEQKQTCVEKKCPHCGKDLEHP